MIGLNFLPPEERVSPAARRLPILPPALGLLVMLVAVGWYFFQLQVAASVLDAANRSIAARRPAVAWVAMRRQGEKLSALERSLTARVKSATVWSALLSRLADEEPAGLYLTAIRQNKGVLRVDGVAANLAALAGFRHDLAGNPYLDPSGVFLGASLSNGGKPGGGYSFSLNVPLRKGEAP